MCMDSVAVASVNNVGILVLHVLEGLVVEAMDREVSWIQRVDGIFSNFVDFLTKPPSS